METQPMAAAMSSGGAVTSVTLTGAATGDAPTVGKAAPDFLTMTTDGKPLRLSDLKGKPVWLTFGASWCQPCRAENPDIQAASIGRASFASSGSGPSIPPRSRRP
jgi:thiol-disulfide isomerase/thioredoxin